MSNSKPKVHHQLRDIVNPHEHDVLSGRGNFVNYHAGNEHFRALVRKHKVAYVACPKPQKGKFSRMIVDEIRSLDPPGRFLKQDATSKLWQDIGEKKALDKTRQALREGAPEIMKEIGVDSGDDADDILDGGDATSPPVLKDPLFSEAAVIGVNDCVNDNLPYHADPQVPISAGHLQFQQFRDPHARHSGVVGAIPHHIQGPNRNFANLYAHHDEDDYDDLEDTFEPRPIDPRIQQQAGPGQPARPQMQQQVDTIPGRPGELGRQSSDRSIKVEKVFIGDGKSSLSKAERMQGSSLSVMSMSMSDFANPGSTVDVDSSNLSDLFSDSVRINDGPSKNTFSTRDSNRSKNEKSQPSLLDMSVATIGDQMSEFGSVIHSKQDFNDSKADMSFSNVFQDDD